MQKIESKKQKKEQKVEAVEGKYTRKMGFLWFSYKKEKPGKKLAIDGYEFKVSMKLEM